MEDYGTKPNLIKRLFDGFHFDRPEGDFELLERENGEPPFFARWSAEAEGDDPPVSREKVSRSVENNRKRLYEQMRGRINPDLILRPFKLGGRVRALAAFINGMADSDQINDFILKPAMIRGCMEGAGEKPAAFAVENVFAMQEAELSGLWEDVKTAVGEGRTAVFVEGDGDAVLMDTRGFASRSVTTPVNEDVVLGPHEGFTENLRTNVTLIRRIIKTDDMVCEFRKTGGRNNNRLAILYREGVANPTLVNEVKRRFARVDTLMVLSLGTLEQLTESNTYSPIPQMLTTERPDRTAAMLMSGHVAVVCEGSPLAGVMPATLFTIFSSGEDAYLRQPVGAVVRVVRYAGALFSVVMPGLFLALAMHHQGMISSEVLSTVIASRNMVFLPLGLELILLLVIFQLLRQAGISAPGAMGQNISIIGGLVLGQAAVSANIVSKVVLILVALCGLGNYCIPDYNVQLASTYYRVTLVLFAWAGGLLGLSGALMITLFYLAGMKSYGVPFLSPVSPRTRTKGPVMTRGRVTMHRRPADDMNAGGPA